MAASLGSQTSSQFQFSFQDGKATSASTTTQAIGPFFNLPDGRFVWLFIDSAGAVTLVLSKTTSVNGIKNTDLHLACTDQ